MIHESPAGEEFSRHCAASSMPAALAWRPPTTAGAGGCWPTLGEASTPAAIATTAEPARRVGCHGRRTQARCPPSTACTRPAALALARGTSLDILRGKKTDKVAQFGHDKLSTFGIGADLTEPQLRGVLRQLIATGAVGLQR